MDSHFQDRYHFFESRLNVYNRNFKNQTVIDPGEGMSNLNRHASKARRLRTASVKLLLPLRAAGSRLRTRRSSRTSAPARASKLALAGALAA